ncbi:hypothetical protein T439DRAFT_379223, partial [Meredithblackwellia eburnea MCA 4105]
MSSSRRRSESRLGAVQRHVRPTAYTAADPGEIARLRKDVQQYLTTIHTQYSHHLPSWKNDYESMGLDLPGKMKRLDTLYGETSHLVERVRGPLEGLPSEQSDLEAMISLVKEDCETLGAYNKWMTEAGHPAIECLGTIFYSLMPSISNARASLRVTKDKVRLLKHVLANLHREFLPILDTLTIEEQASISEEENRLRELESTLASTREEIKQAFIFLDEGYFPPPDFPHWQLAVETIEHWCPISKFVLEPDTSHEETVKLQLAIKSGNQWIKEHRNKRDYMKLEDLNGWFDFG